MRFRYILDESGEPYVLRRRLDDAQGLHLHGLMDAAEPHEGVVGEEAPDLTEQIHTLAQDDQADREGDDAVQVVARPAEEPLPPARAEPAQGHAGAGGLD